MLWKIFKIKSHQRRAHYHNPPRNGGRLAAGVGGGGLGAPRAPPCLIRVKFWSQIYFYYECSEFWFCKSCVLKRQNSTCSVLQIIVGWKQNVLWGGTGALGAFEPVNTWQRVHCTHPEEELLKKILNHFSKNLGKFCYLKLRLSTKRVMYTIFFFIHSTSKIFCTCPVKPLVQPWGFRMMLPHLSQR